MLEKLKNTIQDCNINFLIGSGLSSPFLKTLGRIETLLTELEKKQLDLDTKKLIRASLYKRYFDDVIKKNLDILDPTGNANDVLDQYIIFLKIINSILLKRMVTLLSKEINIFTTNIDIFFEKALEDINLEYNDGFNGRFKPKFSLSNFKKSHFKKSLHYDNTAELPVFNLLKLHGSLTWEIEKNEVVFSKDLNHINAVAKSLVDENNYLEILDDATIETLINEAAGKTLEQTVSNFMDEYDSLLNIVNPQKDKFKKTLLNQTYYELLRLYSNELEKENTVLFAMGFSFADEHICEITLRAANSNPTLIVYVITHSTDSRKEIEERLKNNRNNNIEYISPIQEDKKGVKTDTFNYDFKNINDRVFKEILKKIDCDNINLDDDN